MTQPRSLISLIIVATMLAGVIITALTVLASKPMSQTPTAVLVAPANAATAADEAIVWHEKPIPGPLATVMQDAKGTDTTLAELKGKVLVVNFWATWCAPCVKEMPTLDALQAKLGGPLFQVLAISQDREGVKVAQPFFEKNGWKNVALYVEPKSRFAKDAAIRGLPTTLILDAAGQEIGRLEGITDWTGPDAVQALSRAIEITKK